MQIWLALFYQWHCITASIRSQNQNSLKNAALHAGAHEAVNDVVKAIIMGTLEKCVDDSKILHVSPLSYHRHLKILPMVMPYIHRKNMTAKRLMKPRKERSRRDPIGMLGIIFL